MAKLYRYLSQQGSSTAPDATQENEHSPSSVSPFSCPATKCGRCKYGRGKKVQYKTIKDLKQKLLLTQYLIQMDFAENYCCQKQ